MNEQKQETPIRLVLLDDHALFRVSLGRFLAAEPGFEVVSEGSKSIEALKSLIGSSVDIVLLNFHLGAERAAEFMTAARRGGYQGRFLIVTEEAHARDSAVALKSGASGIFLKSDDPDRLLHAIRLVANGGVWLDQQVVQLLTKDLVDLYPELDAKEAENLLTDRQNKVLAGISRGLTNKKIGENIGLSEGSVKSVVQQLFVKTGVRTRSQLVRMALDGSLAPTQASMKRARSTKPAEDTPKSHGRKRPIAKRPPANRRSPK